MNKICTSLEQSKKLIELGIDVNTADMYYPNRIGVDNYPLSIEWKNGLPLLSQEIPAWSLTALLAVLNKSAYFIDEDSSVNLSSYKTVVWDLGITNSDLELVTESNPVDACYEMILKLHEQNLLCG